MSFASKLIDWYSEYGRDLPWRNTHNPYIIWLSEIILQQTRVEQGMPYFYRFLEHYPTVTKFAEAPEEDILRLWQGLGYYSRARNMHKAAKRVQDDFAGYFPTSYADVITLPGVGEYTAAAIASFSVNEPKAVVDGNVYRVLSRYFGIAEAINSTNGKKQFAGLAQELLDKDRPGIYNQAIMDFGAIQCRPKNPYCETCIFRLDCVAYALDCVAELPIKLKGKKSKNRYFHYFIVREQGKMLMAKREEGDVWANLYEFPSIETAEGAAIDQLQNQPEFQDYFEGNIVLTPVGSVVKHILSHQNIHARFYMVESAADIKTTKNNWDYFLLEKIDKLAKHKLIFSFLERNEYLTNPNF